MPIHSSGRRTRLLVMVASADRSSGLVQKTPPKLLQEKPWKSAGFTRRRTVQFCTSWRLGKHVLVHLKALFCSEPLVPVIHERRAKGTPCAERWPNVYTGGKSRRGVLSLKAQGEICYDIP